MEMKRCERGHYYDASIHGSCPYCRDTDETDRTVAMRVGNTMAMTSAQPAEPLSVTMPLPMAEQASFSRAADDNEGKTVAIFQTEQGVDPAVGWLVCVDGKEKGKDYRIHSDNNYVGRSEKMDICIRNDDTISRENQAVITYDSNERCFFLSPGEGRNILRLNGKAIFQTTELRAYDRVVIGMTELVFLPLCGEKFAWED